MPFAAKAGARGLERSGMIRSTVPGRTDRLPMNVQRNSFVVPADVVSGIGQGNSMAGANALNKMFKSAPGGAAMPSPKAMRMPTGGMMRGRNGFADGGEVMPGMEPDAEIVAAGGEFVLSPEDVAAVGGGDVERGHAILDSFVKQIRSKTIRQLKRLPGPRKS